MRARFGTMVRRLTSIAKKESIFQGIKGYKIPPIVTHDKSYMKSTCIKK